MKMLINKGYFFFKFICHYNLYGNLYLTGFAISIWVSIFILPHVSIVPLFWGLLVICLMVAAYLLFKAVMIISSYKKKYRYYRLSILRLEKRGYKAEFFKMGVFEPCMRIITRDVLSHYGYKERYKELLRAYGGEDPYLNKAKEKLLASLNVGEEKVEFIKQGEHNGNRI
ncbi:MAG: hypothetical protein JEY99_05785 [Spirochaetales bacterium]|nr:hypothetical protein [Spirochaetales bacterium]